MNKKIQEKDIIIGDIHGSADKIKQVLNDMGFTPDKAPIITLGSPPENIPKGNFPNLAEFIEKIKENEENRQKANEANHYAEYQKMHPSKKK